jgi:hypothetical protein
VSVNFRNRTRTRVAALAVIATGMLTACSSGTDVTMHNTITAEQAAQRVEANFRQSLAQLPAHAQPVKQVADTYSCDDPPDNGPKGRVIASVGYRIDGLDSTEYIHYFDTLRTWWTQHDFRVLHESQQPNQLYLWVENNTDGFRQTMNTNDRGELYLVGSSPCVWPNGTPQPTPGP